MAERKGGGTVKDRKTLISKTLRAKIFNMVSVGVIDEPINRFYDFLSIAALVLNLFSAFAITYKYMEEHYKTLLLGIEAVTTFFFAVDYILRLLSANELYPKDKQSVAVRKYILSFTGIVDLVSFLPYYFSVFFPVFFPAGTAVFRLFRVARILRLFRINSYYDQLNVITEVISRKKQQLMASVFIILILMMAASLCMYSVEHEEQPEVFKNAFSGIWWSASTLLTIGYGDIYPVTIMGKIFAIIIAFLGVGMVAIPTGIISAGFVEQFQRLKDIGEFAEEENIHFIRIMLQGDDSWCGRKVSDLGLPEDMMAVAVQRGNETIIPRGDTVLCAGDIVVLCAEKTKELQPVAIKEIVINEGHSWNNTAVRDIDISRQSYIYVVRRGNKTLIPSGDLVIKAGDVVLLYDKHLHNENI